MRRFLSDAGIIMAMAVIMIVALYFVLFRWTAEAQAKLPEECRSFPTECTAVMQNQF